MKIEGIVEKLQNAVENRLLELGELRNVPVITYKQSDLKSVINASLKSGLGTAILLLPPVPGEVNRYVKGPIFKSVTIEIKIIENTAISRCGSSLLSLAELVMCHLHMWHPNVSDENYRLELATGGNCCKADSVDDTNYFLMRFVVPCHFNWEAR